MHIMKVKKFFETPMESDEDSSARIGFEYVPTWVGFQYTRSCLDG